MRGYAPIWLNLEGIAMPYVNIRVAGELTREQKKQIAEEKALVGADTLHPCSPLVPPI